MHGLLNIYELLNPEFEKQLYPLIFSPDDYIKYFFYKKLLYVKKN